MDLKINERIDDLELNGLKIIQNTKGFCFGIDSILLSDFAKGITSNCSIVDLGTGTGILPILLSTKTNAKKIVGIEIQEEVCDMAKRSIKLNNLENKIEIICENIKNLKNYYNPKTFDHVITNPPYKELGTGKINLSETKNISRHEITASLDDFIEISSYLLKDFGSIFMVHRPDRLVDILNTLRKYKLEPKIIRFVHPNVSKPPNLVLIKATKNAKTFLKVLEPLFVYNEDGNYTTELLKIYNKI